jgi:hypothetical protein
MEPGDAIRIGEPRPEELCRCGLTVRSASPLGQRRPILRPADASRYAPVVVIVYFRFELTALVPPSMHSDAAVRPTPLSFVGKTTVGIVAFFLAILEAVSVVDESYDVSGAVILHYLACIRTVVRDRALVQVPVKVSENNAIGHSGHFSSLGAWK